MPRLERPRSGSDLSSGWRFEEIPGLRVGSGPVFAKDEGLDGAVVLEFAQTFLNGDTEVTADSGGTVAVDELKD